MSYPMLALFTVIIFGLTHFWSDKTYLLDKKIRGKLLSLSGGVAISYVFINLLPKLAKNQILVQSALQGLFPYFEKHVYVLALLGFLFFLATSKNRNASENKSAFYLSFFSYALLNFLIGYAVVDKNNPEVKPLILFTLAMGVHLFASDFYLNMEHRKEYKTYGKWIVIICIFLGWAAGAVFTLSQIAIALVNAFIAGGVIVNVMRHELEETTSRNLSWFIISSLVYAFILLTIG